MKSGPLKEFAILIVAIAILIVAEQNRRDVKTGLQRQPRAVIRSDEEHVRD